MHQRRELIVFIVMLIMSACMRPAAEAEKLRLTLAWSGLDKPTHISHAGDGSGRIFAVEQRGMVRVIRNGSLLSAPFLDIRDKVGCCGERGLLGIAFPPGFGAKRSFYLNYTDRAGTTTISRFRISRNEDIADPESEEVILRIEQPYANHNGGQIAFGPDGYLYIGMGDGGSAGDPLNSGQRPDTLLGKMLRIDVESGRKPYAIPAGNPFAGSGSAKPEIWASGLRNPWRFSFDRKTGDLYIADVGQNDYEEINFQAAASRGGENYGWNVMEGRHCFRSTACDRKGLVLPIAEYDHGKGCSVTGGFVYRGKALPSLQGWYLFGDYCSGRIWGIRKTADAWRMVELADTGIAISTFGEDEAGELYAADHRTGNIYRVAMRGAEARKP